MAAEASPMLREALACARRRSPVHPNHHLVKGICDCQLGAKCPNPGKHPRHKGWQILSTTDEATITRWWTDQPEDNVGLLTGQRAGRVVLDVDPEHGGDDSLAELEREHGKLPHTVEDLTGGGGRHLHFKHAGAGIRIKNSTSDLGPGLDIRGEGGQVVAPPSLHVSGRRYEWEISSHPDETPLADMPRWLLELVREPGNGNGHRAGSIPEVIREETRNTTLTSLAGSLRQRRIGQAVIETTLLEVNASQCVPPLPEDEVKQIAVSVSRYPEGEATFHPTDLGNAERFIEANGADLRFVPAWRTWLYYDGRRWARDATNEVYRRAQSVIRSMYVTAGQLEEREAREAAAKWVLRSESREKLEAMVSLARSATEVVATPAQFDTHPWLFNCLNGTVGLKVGQLREHRRADMLTKLAPVAYDPAARLDLWDSFIETATVGDNAFAEFLQRVAGYALTGSTSEEKLFFVHGPEASGKSTLVESLKATMGDYASTADFEAFLSRRDVGGPRNDIARLAGARLVASIEVDEGKRLAEGLVKMLTGGDTVATRFLYQEAFEFVPQFKLFLAANHAPKVREDDGAMWRRILRIPFEHVIPEADRDPRVKATLRDPTVAGPAILAWAVKGCSEWQAKGLGIPPRVEKATKEYRESMDPLKTFLEEYCVIDPAQWVTAGALRTSYEKWAKETGERDLLQGRAWGDKLRARECKPEQRRVMDPSTSRERVTKGWRGIGLADPPDREQESVTDSDPVTDVTSKSVTSNQKPLMGEFTESGVTTGYNVETGYKNKE